MTDFGVTDDLIEPPAIDPVQDAIETCRMAIDEGVEDVRSIKDGERATRPSYRGEEYDEGYAQGRKDLARVLLSTFGIDYLNNSAGGYSL